MDIPPRVTSDMDQMVAALRDAEGEGLKNFTEALVSFIEEMDELGIRPLHMMGFVLGHCGAVIHHMENGDRR